MGSQEIGRFGKCGTWSVGPMWYDWTAGKPVHYFLFFGWIFVDRTSKVSQIPNCGQVHCSDENKIKMEYGFIHRHQQTIKNPFHPCVQLHCDGSLCTHTEPLTPAGKQEQSYGAPLTHCPLENLRVINFQNRFSDWYLDTLMCNCSQMNAAEPQWYHINIG